eukprot:g6300.t1
MPTFICWASVTNGFEFVADMEMHSKLADYERLPVDESDPQSVRLDGKVIFSFSAPGALAAASALRTLWSVEQLFAAVFWQRGLPEDASMLQLLESPESLGGDLGRWSGALALCRAWRQIEQPQAEEKASDVPTFRCSARRGGSHPFSSTEVAQALARGVERVCSWSPELRNYEVDVFCHLRFDVAFVGLRVNDAPLSQSGALVRHGRDLSKTTLKQTIAYSLTASGDIPRRAAEGRLPGTIVVDAMCGCGTIGEAAALAYRGSTFCLSGDASTVAVEKAARNRELLPAGVRGMVDVVQWSSDRLPLRDNVVDQYCIDMPFGKRMGNHAENTRLYPRTMKELVRTLDIGGKAVLLTSAKALILRELQRDRQWKKHNYFGCNMGGLPVSVFVLGKRYVAGTGAWAPAMSTVHGTQTTRRVGGRLPRSELVMLDEQGTAVSYRYLGN